MVDQERIRAFGGIPGAICLVAGSYAAAGGLITLIGWFAGIPRLTSWDGGAISMMPNAAVCAVCAGLAMVLIALGYKWVPLLLGGFVALVGGATLLEYLTGIDLRIDRLLLDPQWGQYRALVRGRMGPPGSMAWTIVGIALALLVAGGRYRAVTTWSGLAVCAIALLSLLGYMFGAVALYTLPRLTTIAFQTSSILAALGVALVACVRDYGLGSLIARDDAGGTLVRRLLLPIIVVPIVLGSLRVAGQKAGLYDTQFGSALFAMAMIAGFVALLLWTADGLSRSSRASAERASLLELTGDAIFIRDHDNRILYWNRGAQELYGYWPHEAIGQRAFELLRTVFSEPLEKIEQALQQSGYWQGELIHTCKDGSTRTVLSRWAIDRSATDPHPRILESNTDITIRKRAEVEREALIAAERSARAEAERSSRLKDEFLATLSHELRTPLNAIMGWSDILSRPETLHDPETHREGVQTISRNARVQAKLIEDLLEMSRIISGKISLDVQHVDLADVIDAALVSVRPAAEARAIRLQKVIDPGAGPVNGDPSRLQQVLWNLLSNAVKFTDRGGRVTVSLKRVDSHVEVEVTDTGRGIDPAFLPHVFERFRQQDGSITRAHGGLGLGLAIVKHLVELHGGRVGVHSDGAGKGATFIVSLPRAAVVLPVGDDTRRYRGAIDSGPGEGMPDLRGLTVLVVDDEPDAVLLIRRLLEECGAAVQSALSADEAMEAMARHHADVMLSDIGMPGKDGYELIRWLRRKEAEEGLGRMPAVALTAFARSEDRLRALQAGFQMHVTKPVEPVELLTVVASVAGRMAAPDVMPAAR